MDKQEFQRRTRVLALEIIRLVDSMPRTTVGSVLGRQLVRSGTAIGANYRAACRAQSDAAMLAKLAIVEEEADETLYWREMIAEAFPVASERIRPIARETDEFLRMTVASIRTMKARPLRAVRTPTRTQANPKSEIRSPK